MAYNNNLRRQLGLPSHNSARGMFVNLNISTFWEILKKYVYSFRNRLETSDTLVHSAKSNCVVIQCADHGYTLHHIPRSSGQRGGGRGVLLKNSVKLTSRLIPVH